jgi:hypothetical protein
LNLLYALQLSITICKSIEINPYKIENEVKWMNEESTSRTTGVSAENGLSLLFFSIAVGFHPLAEKLMDS